MFTQNKKSLQKIDLQLHCLVNHMIEINKIHRNASIPIRLFCFKYYSLRLFVSLLLSFSLLFRTMQRLQVNAITFIGEGKDIVIFVSLHEHRSHRCHVGELLTF